MKILIEPATKYYFNSSAGGIIVYLDGFSTQANYYYTIDEIKSFRKENPSAEIFVTMNRNFFNEDIEDLKNILLQLENIGITAIIFYDLAILQLKNELNLKLDLVWSQTHMVNNYKTCNYYHKKGVKFAYLSKEIIKEEIKEIAKNSQILTIVEVVGLPTVAYSRRSLITNYYKDLNKEVKTPLVVTEKLTGKEYLLTEDKFGTSFTLNELVNGTSYIKEFYESNVSYIVLKQDNIESDLYDNLIIDTKDYIDKKCSDDAYLEKYKLLGNYTNFFELKTYYQVKKHE